METLTVGCKAYFDSFVDLIPARVAKIRTEYGVTEVTLILTATRGANLKGDYAAYQRGQAVTTTTLHAVPRKSVYVRNGQYRIRCYRVEVL
jgi:hypothetical protein